MGWEELARARKKAGGASRKDTLLSRKKEERYFGVNNVPVPAHCGLVYSPPKGALVLAAACVLTTAASRGQLTFWLCIFYPAVCSPSSVPYRIRSLPGLISHVWVEPIYVHALLLSSAVPEQTTKPKRLPLHLARLKLGSLHITVKNSLSIKQSWWVHQRKTAHPLRLAVSVVPVP